MKYINKSVFNGIAGYLGPKPEGAVIHNDAGSMSAEQYVSWLAGHAPETGFAQYYGDRHCMFRAEDTFNRAWHCGESYANNNLVGYEVCESMSASDPDFLQNEQAVFGQVAIDFKEWGMQPTPGTIRLHCEFVPTACPHRSMALHGGTVASVKGYMVAEILKKMNGIVTEPPKPSQPVIHQGGKLRGEGLEYRAHIPNQGDLGYMQQGQIAGTTGKAIPIEAIDLLYNGSAEFIEVEGHIQDEGWRPVSKTIGTKGKGKHLEAFRARLTGKLSERFELQYQTHIATLGWTYWKFEGEVSGTVGKGLAIEAVRFRLVQKPISQGHPLRGVGLEYRTHIAHQGYLGYVDEGQLSGTTGLAIQVEALEVLIDGKNGCIELEGQVAQIGWQPASKLAGTVGKGLQLEAFRLRLKGELAKIYDIEYRSHVQDKGWLPWVKNGGTTGTVGEVKRIEAVEIRLIKK